MKRPIAGLWVAAVLAAALVAGCSKDNVTGPPPDQGALAITSDVAALKYLAGADGFAMADDSIYVDAGVLPTDYEGLGKVAADIIPIRWGRFVNSVVRDTTVTMLGDSMAMVNIQRDVHGDFAILAKHDSTDTVFTLVNKSFIDHTTRNILFRLIRKDTTAIFRWIPIATSLIDGGTLPPNDNIHLTKLTFSLASGDSVSVTNPDSTFLRYFWRWPRAIAMFKHDDVPEFRGGEPVILRATVVSKDSTGDIVVLRIGPNNDAHNRWRLHFTLVSSVNNGDGTWTRVYQIARSRAIFMHFHPGWFALSVDAITRSTLFDDTAPYSASFWAVPYRVVF